jgi:uncharacterized protein YebE (UPF0316 family)
MEEFFGSWTMTWVLIPLMIFTARVLDVSIGTLRLIYISKGFRILAPLLGFFEVIIWLIAIRQIMQHLDNYMCYLAYGLGFATGNYVGMLIDDWLSVGHVIIRVFVKQQGDAVIQALRKSSFGVTVLNAEGMTGPIRVFLSIMKRKSLKAALHTIHQHDPQAFYTIEDLGMVKQGYFKPPVKKPYFTMINAFSFGRKGK